MPAMLNNSLNDSSDFAMTAFDELLKIVSSDLAGRKAPLLCRPSFMQDAVASCIKAESVTIITGFFIKDAQASETDGPPGAAVLARALMRLGKSVGLVTDRRNISSLNACCSVLGEFRLVAIDEPAVEISSDLLIFVERPGRASDGRYYNMRGKDISSVIAPLDRYADMALSDGRYVIGIGDGGNEAGMGLLNKELIQLMPEYAPYLSQVSATVCLPSDTSNWGAYALSAALSRHSKLWLGVEPDEEAAMLSALSVAGAVDGVSGRSGLSVDGFPILTLKEVAFQLKKWYFEHT